MNLIQFLPILIAIRAELSAAKQDAKEWEETAMETAKEYAELKTEEQKMLARLHLQSQKMAELEKEVERWKDEYQNLCKFANDYEAQRDALKAENERLKDILGCCERQQYGFKNAWACAAWRKCDLHGMYGTMGNWQDDDRCPWCRVIVVLGQENGG